MISLTLTLLHWKRIPVPPVSKSSAETITIFECSPECYTYDVLKLAILIPLESCCSTHSSRKATAKCIAGASKTRRVQVCAALKTECAPVHRDQEDAWSPQPGLSIRSIVEGNAYSHIVSLKMMSFTGKNLNDQNTISNHHRTWL